MPFSSTKLWVTSFPNRSASQETERKWKLKGITFQFVMGGKMAYVFHCNIATGHLLLIKNNGNETLGVVGKVQIMLGHQNLWLFCEYSNLIIAVGALFTMSPAQGRFNSWFAFWHTIDATPVRISICSLLFLFLLSPIFSSPCSFGFLLLLLLQPGSPYMAKSSLELFLGL